MLRNTLIMVIVLFSLQAYSQKLDYIITSDGDSISGEVDPGPRISYYKAREFKLILTDGKKMKFDAETVKFMKFNGEDFYSLLIKPHKAKKTDRDLMHVRKKGAESTIYCRYHLDNVGGGPYGGGSVDVETYYLYHNDKFIDYLEHKNFRELLPKYFSEDEKWVREIIHNKKLKFADLFIAKKDKRKWLKELFGKGF